MDLQESVDLYHFRKRWADLGLGEMKSSGKFVVPALVTIETLAGTLRDHSTVTINCRGYEGGRIEISPTRKLRMDEVHLGFDATYQDYRYVRKEGALVITGSSPKMRGLYTVTLQPE